MNMKDQASIYFGLRNNVVKYLINLKLGTSTATTLSTYDFSTVYLTLPHNVIKDKRIDRTFQREGSPYLVCHYKCVFHFGTAENI